MSRNSCEPGRSRPSASSTWKPHATPELPTAGKLRANALSDLRKVRRDVLEILVLGRRDPFAADVVDVAFLELHRSAEFAGLEHVHVGVSVRGDNAATCSDSAPHVQC